MKRIVTIALASVAMLAMTIGTAQAQSPFLFQFDENGHGKFTFTDGSVRTTTGYLQADTTAGGINGSVLVYDLPSLVTSGDVAFYDPGSPNQEISDVFRFADWNGASGVAVSHLIFYSGLGDGDLADTGLPTIQSSGAPVAETGVEGGEQWCIWDTGWPSNNRYEGLSDVPEAGSMALWMALGVPFTLMVRRAKRH